MQNPSNRKDPKDHKDPQDCKDPKDRKDPNWIARKDRKIQQENPSVRYLNWCIMKHQNSQMIFEASVKHVWPPRREYLLTILKVLVLKTWVERKQAIEDPELSAERRMYLTDKHKIQLVRRYIKVLRNTRNWNTERTYKLRYQNDS